MTRPTLHISFVALLAAATSCHLTIDYLEGNQYTADGGGGAGAAGAGGTTTTNNGGGGTGGQGGSGGMQTCEPACGECAVCVMAPNDCQPDLGASCDSVAGGMCDSAGACVNGLARWVSLFGTANDQRARAVASISNGEVIVAGEFASALTIGNEVQTQGSGDTDIFVARVAGDTGNGLSVTDWGNTSLQQVHDLAVDSGDHIVVAGEYAGELTPLSGAAINTDGYVLRLNSDLSVDWKAEVTGSGTVKRVRGVATTATHVYAVGDFDGTTLSTLNSGPMMRDAFVVAYEAETANSFPTAVWQEDFNGGSGDVVSAAAVAADSGSHAIVVGTYTGAPTFMMSMPLADAGSLQSIFVAKITSAGSLVWIRTFGGSASEQVATDVATDGDQIIVVGHYQGDLGVNGIAPNNDATDVFLMKLDSDGMPLWGAAHPSPGEGRAQAVTVDGSGNIIMVGDFQSEVSCGPIMHQCNGSGLDAFVFKLTRDGDRIWTYTAGSQDMNDTFWDVSTDAADNVFLAGEVRGNFVMELSGMLNMPSAAGGVDVLVAGLAP